MTQTAPETARQTLAWVDIETRPYDVIYSGGGYDTGPEDSSTEIHAHVLAMLSPTMAQALEAVIDNPDAATCAANGCEHPVGEALVEDDERPSGGGLIWHWTALVDLGNRVLAVCEDCSPETLYVNA